MKILDRLKKPFSFLAIFALAFQMLFMGATPTFAATTTPTITVSGSPAIVLSGSTTPANFTYTITNTTNSPYSINSWWMQIRNISKTGIKTFNYVNGSIVTPIAIPTETCDNWGCRLEIFNLPTNTPSLAVGQTVNFHFQIAFNNVSPTLPETHGIFLGAIQGSMTIFSDSTASFTVNNPAVIYNASFNVDGSVTTVPTAAGSTIVTPPNPTKPGYTFYGWLPVVPATMPAANQTFVAQWTLNNYTLTFNSAGGSAVSSITQGYGSAVTAPTNPTKTGSTFTGWSPAVPTIMPLGGASLTAGWSINTYVASFNVDGTITNVSTPYGATIVVPASPTKTGYTFTGWLPAPTTMPASNQTFVARWSVNSYNANFVVDGVITTVSTIFGSTIVTPPNPTKPGYTFSGWLPVVPATMPAADQTFVAQWTAIRYTINFDSAGGTQINPITQDYGTAVTMPTPPTKTGNTFAGWSSVPATMPLGGATLTARWIAVPGTIEIKNVVSPSDNSSWNFGIDAGYGGLWDTWKTNGYTSGQIYVAFGQHSVVGQTAPGTNGTQYVSTVECRDGETVVSTGGPASLVYGQNLVSTGFNVASDQHVVCTFTNTKKGTIEIKNVVSPSDNSSWNFGIDAGYGGLWDTWKTNGYTSGQIYVALGQHSVVGQTAPGVNGTQYVSTVECRDGETVVSTGGPASLVYGQNLVSTGFDVASDQHVVCTFTNTKKGTIEIKNVVSPSDNSFWNFGIDAGYGGLWDTWKANGYTSGQIYVALGQHSVVGQTAPGVNGTQYVSTVECRDGETVVSTGGPASLVYGQNLVSTGFDVASDQHVVCTFTNTKKGTAPVITLNGEASVDVVYGSGYTESGATATESAEVIVGGDVITPTTPVGIYHIIYSTFDATRDPSVPVTRTVNVKQKAITITPAPATSSLVSNNTQPNLVAFNNATSLSDAGVLGAQSTLDAGVVADNAQKPEVKGNADSATSTNDTAVEATSISKFLNYMIFGIKTWIWLLLLFLAGASWWYYAFARRAQNKK